MLKKLVVATLACLTIFLARRSMSESQMDRRPAPSAQRASDSDGDVIGHRPIRTASAL